MVLSCVLCRLSPQTYVFGREGTVFISQKYGKFRRRKPIFSVSLSILYPASRQATVTLRLFSRQRTHREGTVTQDRIQRGNSHTGQDTEREAWSETCPWWCLLSLLESTSRSHVQGFSDGLGLQLTKASLCIHVVCVSLKEYFLSFLLYSLMKIYQEITESELARWLIR